MPSERDSDLRQWLRIIDLFRSQPGATPNTPLAVLEAFLLVCLYEGASLKDLCDVSGQAQSTLSRHLLDLGDRNRSGGPGLKLVAWRHPPEELRRKEYFLTAKGKALRDQMLEPERLSLIAMDRLPTTAPSLPLPEVQGEVMRDYAPPSLADRLQWGYRSTTAPRKRRRRCRRDVTRA